MQWHSWLSVEIGEGNRNSNRNPCTFTYLNPCSATIISFLLLFPLFRTLWVSSADCQTPSESRVSSQFVSLSALRRQKCLGNWESKGKSAGKSWAHIASAMACFCYSFILICLPLRFIFLRLAQQNGSKEGKFRKARERVCRAIKLSLDLLTHFSLTCCHFP